MMATSVKPKFCSSQYRPTSASPRGPKLPKNAFAPPPNPPPAYVMKTLGMNGRIIACLRLTTAAWTRACGARELGAVLQALDDQVIERDVVGDQVNDALGRLDRHHDDFGVEHQQADQVGGGDEYLAAGELGVPAPVFHLGQCTAMVGFEAQSELGVASW